MENFIATAIEKMRGFQAPSGGFSYWPGEYEIHEWTSSYAGYFLLEASRLGYHVPAGMLELWKKHQKALANSWTEGPEQGPPDPGLPPVHAGAGRRRRPGGHEPPARES